MKFFDIFRKRKTNSIPESIQLDGNSLFFHEDDYCQTELSPIENVALFVGESDKINKVAKESFDGFGYSEIYVRNDKRVELAERKIIPSQLEELIKEIGLQRYSSVQTGYGQSYRIPSLNTIGYGKGYSAIYFDFKEDIVLNIWLVNHFSMDKEKLSECLLQIGEKWKLLLMDWSQTVAVNISDKNSIKKYLENP